MRPLIEALHRRAVPRPPVWIMRQAGRYLPEYRELREGRSFQECVADPALAAEITLQPIRRFAMDGAVIFADIMTPLEAMGVEIVFDPGPQLQAHDLVDVAELPVLDTDRVGHVAETIRRVRAAVPEHTAVIGFAGAPMTLLAYLLEGGGSKDFMRLRGALRSDPDRARVALRHLGESMQAYLRMQIDAGADAVQLFDSWAGVLDRETYSDLAVPAAQVALAGLGAPRIYFAPGAGHTLERQTVIGAEAYGVDWRIPIDEAWDRLGDVAVQGNIDPAVLLADAATIRREVAQLRERVGTRPGHVMNLGHGIDRRTPPEHVEAFVEAVRS